MILKKSKYLILVMLSFMAFSACEDTVSLDLDFESDIVINALFNTDSPWLVDVSTSRNSLDSSSEIEQVETARVTIYDHNNIELYELYHIENGTYGREGYYPSSTRTYNIKVEVGAKVLTARSYVPGQAKLKINNLSVVKQDQDEGVEVNFQIEDKSEIEAYYIWEIINLTPQEIEVDLPENEDKLSDIFINNLSGNSITDPTKKIEILGGGVFGDGTYSTTYNTLIGRNRSRGISGNTKPNYDGDTNILNGVGDLGDFDELVDALSISGDDDDPIEDGEIEENKPKFELRVVSISTELFEWYNSVEKVNSIPNKSDLNHIPVYTNINNGLGIFAGFNESIIRF